ncbi:MAG: META domain-containing protein [Sideroxyarcus sp.]|nr:META domain-containing protein [Sideroxyarcus sp.]
MRAVFWSIGFLMMALPALAEDLPWRLVAVDGAEVGYRATIDLSQDGRVSGQGPCNRYFADMTTELPEFKLGAIGATKMACPDLAAEAAFFALLTQMELAEVLDAGLVLSGAEHTLRFVQK